MRMIVRTLPKFEHQTITISVEVSANSANHLISIYVYMYTWNGMETTFLTATVYIHIYVMYK